MANVLYYPHLNPVKFYQPAPDTVFHSRHIDDFEFFDTIAEWEQHTDYHQPWQNSDAIRLQFMADFGPHQVAVVNQEGSVLNTIPFTKSLQNINNPSLALYTVSIDLVDLPEGLYRLRMTSGIDNPLVLESNPLSVLNIQKHTLHLQYQHHQYHEGVIFDDFFFTLRVEGANAFKLPASKDSLFEDQTLNETLTGSTPFRIYELVVGDRLGVPDYLIDIINRALTCSTVTIDGRAFTKNEGAKWEVNEQDGLVSRGWKLELRETVNRPARVVVNGQPHAARIAIVANADSKGFMSTGGSTFAVQNLE